MKKRISIYHRHFAFAYVLLVAVLFSACTDATDRKKCLNNVKSIYPKSIIYQDPENAFSFFVVDSSGLRKVTTLNLRDANVDGVIEFQLVE